MCWIKLTVCLPVFECKFSIMLYCIVLYCIVLGLWILEGIMAFLPLCWFAPWLFHLWLFRPWLFWPLACLLPGLFAPWLVRPLADSRSVIKLQRCLACTIKNCNCSAIDMSHYVYRNLQATKISKLQLIVALHVIYIWQIVFILTSYT